MYINYSTYSSIGGRRKNEDVVQIVSYPESVAVFVADGAGDHRNGDAASRMAVNAVSGEICDGAASRMLLERAIAKANEKLLLTQPDGNSMRTTIAVLWMNDDQAWAAHVGNTRLYQFRDGRIAYQSADHSAAQLSVMLGEIEEKEIRGHGDCRRLTRALGARANVKIDSVKLDVKPGDAFLLCSDGFWELIWEEEMLKDLQLAKDAQKWLAAMKTRVERRSKPRSDNHTAAAIMVL